MWIIYIFLFFVFMLVLLFFYKLSELKFIYKKICKCTENLNDVFETKEMYLNEIIKNKKNKKLEEKMTYYVNVKDIFEKEKILFNVNWEIVKQYPDLRSNDKFTNVFEYIYQTNEEIDGLKDFYNINVDKFNCLFDKKMFSFVYKSMGYKRQRNFSFRKLNEYEIEKD